MQLTGLAGARVIVTAGGSGIGSVIAARFAEAGARVFTCDVDPGCVSDARRRPQPRDRAPCVADVARRGRRGPLFDEALAHLGGLDVLVNNAGVGGPVACVEDVSPDEWRRTWT